jgi:hypothetical protein
MRVGWRENSYGNARTLDLPTRTKVPGLLGCCFTLTLRDKALHPKNAEVMRQVADA